MASSTRDDGSQGDVHALNSNGAIEQPVVLPRDGVYVLRVQAFGRQAGPDPARMKLRADGRTLRTFDVSHERDAPGVFEVEVTLAEGRHLVEMAFINDYYRPEHEDPKQRDRNLYVDWLEVVGPTDLKLPPAGSAWMFALDPGRGAAHRRAVPILKELLTRAYRRPARSDEITRAGQFVRKAVEEGKSFEEAMRLAVVATLVSPHFLFRLEPGAVRGTSGSVRNLEPWALASRLSYFLWSTAPDALLRERARVGDLGQAAVLRAETERMLGEGKARALGDHFAAQWLELRNLESIHPDPDRFPGCDDALKRSMRAETESFVSAVIRENRPVRDLILADFTFLDERLARHYGIAGIEGDELRRVLLGDDRIGGLLGHGSILTVTSNPTRTSPTKRGRWILENVLGAPPPPPPPGADSLEGEETVNDAASLRERLAVHRQQADCAACHVRMDALGLALENFDVVGRWRKEDEGQTIDASGELPDGRKLDGVQDVRQAVATDPGLIRCVAKKLFIYAVGRDVLPADELALEQLAHELGEDATFRDVILGIISLDAFTRRRIP
jgi:hypothetical protein